jgi:hypothetical protein
MVPEGAQDRVRQVRQDLKAARVKSVPDKPGRAFWDGIGEAFLPAMPLWWRNDRIPGVAIRSAHDGQRIAIELSWNDATLNDHVLTQNAFTDGVAIQISASDTPPFFGMGSADEPVNLWHWKAAWQRDATSGRPELTEVHPNMPRESEGAYTGIPTGGLFQTASAVGNPLALGRSSVMEDANASRFSTLTSQSHTDQSVHGVGHRTKHGWAVTFVRELAAGTSDDVAFGVGKTVSIAFAVWDGAFGDRNGKKAVTIWHGLTLVD